MNHRAALVFITMVFLGACGPENIRYSERLKGTEIRAVVYIAPLPEPACEVIYLGADMGGITVLPAAREEKKMKDILAASGFREILMRNIKAAGPDLKGIVALEDVDNGLENADHRAIAAALNDSTNAADGFNSIRKKSSAGYLLAVSVDRWGYHYSSYSRSCYYDVELTSELVDMATGEVLWRRSPRAYDVIHAAPVECEPVQRHANDALDLAARLQIKAMTDHIKEKP